MALHLTENMTKRKRFVIILAISALLICKSMHRHSAQHYIYTCNEHVISLLIGQPVFPCSGAVCVHTLNSYKDDQPNSYKEDFSKPEPLNSHTVSHTTTHSTSDTLPPHTTIYNPQDCSLYSDRLDRYCHQSLLNEARSTSGLEGRLEGVSDELELMYVHIVARHGDRSPATRFTVGYPEVFYECGLGSMEGLGNWRYDVWAGLNDFPPLVPLGKIRNEKLQLHPGKQSHKCQVGELTSLGFLQHLNLGSLMQLKYSNLLDGLNIKDDIFVQSTDYRRTIRSASAFLLGFLPDDKDIRSLTPIHVSPGDLNEAPPPGSPWVHRPCRNLGQLAQEELQKSDYFAEEKSFHWLQEKMIDMFNLPLPRSQPIWTKIFDHVMTRGCHAKRTAANPEPQLLPCTKDDQCIDCGVGRMMFDFADWSWTKKYPPNSSYLGILPFLRHSLMDTMDSAIFDMQRQPYKFLLTFTHDSTLVFLFQALGLPVKEWTPYASRLVFELWKTSDTHQAPRFYVRVLLNGNIVTRRLPYAHGREVVDYATWRDELLSMQKLASLVPLCVS